MRPRTQREVLVDEAVTLWLLREAEALGERPPDRLWLQKATFLTTYHWFRQRWKGFSYSFFRYRYGPFTRDLYQTEVDLAGAELIACGEGWTLRVTPRGQELAEIIQQELWQGENRPFAESLHRDLRWLARFRDTESLLQAFYDLEVVPLGWSEPIPLREVPLGVDLTRVLEDEEAVRLLVLSDPLLETIGLCVAESAWVRSGRYALRGSSA